MEQDYTNEIRTNETYKKEYERLQTIIDHNKKRVESLNAAMVIAFLCFVFLLAYQTVMQYGLANLIDSLLR